MPLTTPLVALCSVWLILVFLGLTEAFAHRRRLARIPVRVHVNGTRGKSSVVRLITAGLRAGGLSVCAKTTGTFATFIDPDGTEHPLHRPSQPNIIEQVRVLGRIAALAPDVAVVECMAVQPQFISLTELKMVRSTHGVITNARPDHLDVMGPTADDVALALVGSTPVSGRLFTAERERLDAFRHACEDRDTTLHVTDPDHVEHIEREAISRFAYTEHSENVALALDLCEALGVDRDTALEGMVQLTPDPGATRILHIDFFGRDLVFVNAFAANDPDSTERLWERVIEGKGEGRTRIALVNCRADRPNRSGELAAVAGTWSTADQYVLMGSGTFLFARAAVRAGIPADRILVCEHDEPGTVIEEVLAQCPGPSVIVGMCNIHGGGQEVARWFSNRARDVEEL